MKAARLATLVIALAATEACAGSPYQELRREVDSYTPPAPPVLAAPAGAAAPAVPDQGADAFAAARGSLRELAQEWTRALEPGTDGAFLVPDAGRMQALLAAATDEAAAGQALADGFSLEALEALALLRSPMVAAKEREAKAALEVFDQAEQIDVVLRRYAALTGSAMGASGGMGPAPAFPFPAVLSLKGRIVAEQVRGAREELEAARRDAVTMARRAYWELHYLGSAADVTRAMLDLLDNLVASVNSRYEAGQTSFQDLVRVRIEREKVSEELRTLAEERSNMEAEIRGLLALTPAVAVGAPERREPSAVVPDQRSLEELALARRQEVRAADAMVSRMELMLEMAETMTYPGFDLGGSGQRPSLVPAASGTMAAAGGSGAMAAAATASPAGPVRPFYGGDEAYVRELRQRVAALGAEREAARAAALVGVRGAWFAFDRARREAALYGERVQPLSQSAIESSLRGYTAGRVMFSDLLESYTGWLEAGLARERARADLGSARAGLEAAAGVSPIAAGM